MDATNWLRECARLRNAETTSQSLNEKIHFLFLNEGCLCGVPDEIFCELSLEAADRVCTPLLFFLTDILMDVLAICPTEKNG